MIKKRKGFVLIAAIMLIVFVSIAVLGLSTFIVQWFDQLDTDVLRAKCLYLAQAGIQNALYQVRSRKFLNPATTYGWYTGGSIPVDTGETYHLGLRRIVSNGLGDMVGGMADFLIVDASNPLWTSSTRTLSGIYVQKAINSPAVTIATVNVCWTKSSATNRNINRIVIGSRTWTVTVSSAACPGNLANGTDVALTTSFVPFSIRWANTITLTNVTIRFNMLDGSTKTVVLWPASSSCQFTINSTGEVAGDTKNTYRTIKATYDLMPATYATDAKIADIDEIEERITSP